MAQYSFMTLTYPGATATFAQGINDSGEIVGAYRDSSGINHGFIYNSGTYTTFDVPGAQLTVVNGVNSAGQIVGRYETDVEQTVQSHGFIANVGGITSIQTLDYPGAAGTEAEGINAAGQVVGRYSNTYDRGFLYQGGSYTSLNYPGATNTEVDGIDDNGDVVGTYFDSSSVDHGFYTRGGGTVLEEFDYPDATATLAEDQSNLGEIVGTYSDGEHQHGFDRGDGYVPIDIPGATDTHATGVNDSGQIVGFSTDSAGNTTSFLATPLCFVAGTRIRTRRGDVAVEALRIGDIVETASGGWRPVRWLGCRALEAVAADAKPVRIRAGAFGGGLPERDLYLSPGHPVLVGDPCAEDAVLVPIMCLVNGTSIARTRVGAVAYWHVELDAHDVLLAEGLPAESFLDLCNRAWFEGGDDDALTNPDLVRPGFGGRCRPVEVEGPRVVAERRRLDAVFVHGLARQCDWPTHEDASWLRG